MFPGGRGQSINSGLFPTIPSRSQPQFCEHTRHVLGTQNPNIISPLIITSSPPLKPFIHKEPVQDEELIDLLDSPVSTPSVLAGDLTQNKIQDHSSSDVILLLDSRQPPPELVVTRSSPSKNKRAQSNSASLGGGLNEPDLAKNSGDEELKQFILDSDGLEVEEIHASNFKRPRRHSNTSITPKNVNSFSATQSFVPPDLAISSNTTRPPHLDRPRRASRSSTLSSVPSEEDDTPLADREIADMDSVTSEDERPLADRKDIAMKPTETAVHLKRPNLPARTCTRSQHNVNKFKKPISRKILATEPDGSGHYEPSTCHQCRVKTTRPKMNCDQSQDPQCLVRVCHNCLMFHTSYDDRPELRPPNFQFVPGGSMLCVKCRGICPCAFCRRKRGEIEENRRGLGSNSKGFHGLSADGRATTQASARKKAATGKQAGGIGPSTGQRKNLPTRNKGKQGAILQEEGAGALSPGNNNGTKKNGGTNKATSDVNNINNTREELMEKFYLLEKQKADVEAATTQLTVILQSEASCPDKESKELLRLLKLKVRKQLEEPSNLAP